MLSAVDKRSWVNAYDWIKNVIESGGFEMGQPLSENYLAKKIGVSRTPIREALRRLEQDDYVKIIPHKGAFVSRVSFEDVKEIYDIRKLLEPFAALSAATRVPDKEIDEIEAEWNNLKKEASISEDKIDLSRVADMDFAFHSTIIKYASNKRIGAIMSAYYAQIRRFQLLSAQYLSNINETVRQHVELLDSLKKRDPKEFSDLIYIHIVQSEGNIMKDYFLKGASF